MAQELKIEQLDDLDGSPAAEKVRFMLDGTCYEIDLSTRHAARLREELAVYIRHARRRRPPPRAGGKRPGAGLPAIGEYAEARGYTARDPGWLPERIISEYSALKGLKNS